MYYVRHRGQTGTVRGRHNHKQEIDQYSVERAIIFVRGKKIEACLFVRRRMP
jgi:hypothetical protein